MHIQLEKTTKDDFGEAFEKIQQACEGLNAVSAMRAMADYMGQLLALGAISGIHTAETTDRILNKLIPESIKESFDFFMSAENRKDVH